jgi:hypothetical protein
MVSTQPAGAAGMHEAGNPCFFIVGCLRSGTSVFRRVVDAHREIAVVDEAEWLPRVFEQRKHRDQRDLRGAGRTRDVLVGDAVRTAVFGHPRFERLGLSEADVRECAGGRDLRYQEFVRGCFDAYGSRAGKILVGEKSPGYVRHLPTLHFLWPRARFVHLIRDGRDVCLSLRAWKPEKQMRTVGRFSTWSDEPYITAGLWWEWHVRLGIEARARLGPLIDEMRYESLVAEPEEQCRALCRFLGVTYDAEMWKFADRYPQAERERRRGPGVPLTVGMRDWRAQLGLKERIEFEAAAGDLLDELGYGRSVTVDRATQARADRTRASFELEATPRRRKVLSWCEVPE